MTSANNVPLQIRKLLLTNSVMSLKQLRDALNDRPRSKALVQCHPVKLPRGVLVNAANADIADMLPCHGDKPFPVQ